ncbi:MAG: hypothetical protein HC880_19245 [Bacteroidia bacterium]|nr:hypothetical protein [Bacteroidia bacterium]
MRESVLGSSLLLSCQENNRETTSPAPQLPLEIVERTALPEETDPGIITETLGSTLQDA